MDIIYELPDYWIEGADKIEIDSTADYVFDDLAVTFAKILTVVN